MTLLELLKRLELSREFGIDFKLEHKSGPVEVDIEGIAYDSKAVRKGFLFVAIKGFSADGHNYIKDAIGRGAAAVITDEAVGNKVITQIAGQDKLAHIVTTHSRKALAHLSAAFYGEPSNGLSLIGITGTNGKTTTSYITKSILDAMGEGVGLLGTINYIIGDRTIKAAHTTPESLELQRYLREMVDNGAKYAVLEVSSHALSLDRVECCAFKAAAFTNFSQDHLDFHGTMEDYFSAKSRLFAYLRRDGCAVLNWDDPMIRRMADKLDCRVITCGFEEGAELRAVDVKGNGVRTGLSFKIQTPEGAFEVESGLSGRFNIYNILISAGIARALGVRDELIQKGVREAGPVAGRFEMIDEGQRFLCVVDYAHTEDALRNLIQEARLMTKGRVITVFGCGGNRDRSKRPLMGAVASELSDVVIVTSDNPRNEKAMEIIKDILNGITRNNCTVQPDRAEAIREAVSMAEDGDVLLVAGKGHEDYQEVKGERFAFSDREVLKKAIQRRK